MQDFTKDLTILLTGSGSTTHENIAALMEDYIFGPLDNREVSIVVPYAGKVHQGLASTIKWCKSQGITGDDFVAIAEPDIEHISQEDAGKFVRMAQGESLDHALGILFQDKEEGREVVLMSIYNPDSAADLSDIFTAKKYDWLPTLNLSEGLVDFFEGYESNDDRIKREALEEAFAEQQKAKEESAPAKKTAAKKATTPRKRAASKVVKEVPTPTPTEPEKVTEAPCIHYFIWVDDNKGICGMFCKNCSLREEDCQDEKPSTELSGTIVVGKLPDLPKDLSLVSPEEVWQDVAKATPPTDSVMVKRDDLAQLGKSMENMAIAFSDAMSVFTKILKEN